MIRVTVHSKPRDGYRELPVCELILAADQILERIQVTQDLTITHIGDSMICVESPYELYGKGDRTSETHTLLYRFRLDGTRAGSNRIYQFIEFRRQICSFAGSHPEHCTEQVRQEMRHAS